MRFFYLTAACYLFLRALPFLQYVASLDVLFCLGLCEASFSLLEKDCNGDTL